MSLFALLQIACLATFGALLLVAAWQDLRTLRIADGLALGIVASSAVWALGGLALGTSTYTSLGLGLLGAVVLFAAGAGAFAVGALGGGDVKLLAAAGLFAGPGLMPDFLLVTAIVGGLLGAAILAGVPLSPAGPASDTAATTQLKRGLPYGPAIAAGGLWVATLLALH
jgi:prepilin peptidase CpaA